MTDERTVLAGGCSWRMQDLSRHYDGGIADSPIGLDAWLLDHNDADGQPATAVASTLNRDGGGGGVDDRTTGMIDGRVGDSQSITLTGRLRTLYEWVKPATPSPTVPTIVPETRQNRVLRANASQLDRSVKWKRVKDLRGKSKMSERQISV